MTKLLILLMLCFVGCSHAGNYKERIEERVKKMHDADTTYIKFPLAKDTVYIHDTIYFGEAGIKP